MRIDRRWYITIVDIQCSLDTISYTYWSPRQHLPQFEVAIHSPESRHLIVECAIIPTCPLVINTRMNPRSELSGPSSLSNFGRKSNHVWRYQTVQLCSAAIFYATDRFVHIDNDKNPECLHGRSMDAALKIARLCIAFQIWRVNQLLNHCPIWVLWVCGCRLK